MSNKVRDHFKRHMRWYVIITNAMIAVSAGVLGALGLFSDMISVPVLVANAVVFAAIGIIGKFGNEQLEDIPLIDKVEQECENAEVSPSWCPRTGIAVGMEDQQSAGPSVHTGSQSKV